MVTNERHVMWLSARGTALSIVACYGTLGVVTVLSLLGITLAPNVEGARRAKP
jgi:hypothetical protein